jgi:RNA polymerase sigma-70 factor (ECF subfamily)
LSVDHQRLVSLASRGDVDAFAKLVNEHSAFVEATAARILGKDEAQDASQEVWVKVWQNIRRFRGDSSFSTWLYRITTNTCLSARKTELRRTIREHGDEMPSLAESLGGESDPEAVALNAERREEIEAALVHVRAEHRAALVLRHMEGLSYAEIAEVLKIPCGTAKGWVSRGRAAMLVALARDDGEHRKEVSTVLAPLEV